jgi:uncharacterized membrane protein YdjX (TVP38/TMEM64 family)
MPAGADRPYVEAAPARSGSRGVAWILTALAAAVCGWAWWSYGSGGLIRALLDSSPGSAGSLAAIRAAIERTGPYGPAVYVLAVVAEVMIAPLPGTLLYAPAGAIFGGALGGTLSLAGNTIGALLAAAVARLLGQRLTRLIEQSKFERYAELIRRRGVLVVVLLRINPLTSSDLVSYAAGIVGLSPWRVGLGTLVGMAPLCYAQAYAAEAIFEWLPGAGWVVLLFGVAYAAVVIALLVRLGRRGRG